MEHSGVTRSASLTRLIGGLVQDPNLQPPACKVVVYPGAGLDPGSLADPKCRRVSMPIMAGVFTSSAN
jgi:hypothetical protein